jgi:REP element-mobilizing transposase RayT
MPTYFKLHYHVVFSTLGRDPCLTKEIRSRLWDYLGGTVNGLGAQSRGSGGWVDHAHLLIDIKPSLVVTDIIREVKKASSIWLKETMGVRNFAWQEVWDLFGQSLGQGEGPAIYREPGGSSP